MSLSSIFRRAPAPAAQNGTAVVDKDPLVEVEKTLSNLRDQIKRGLDIKTTPTALAAVLDLIKNKDSIDDRNLFLEYALTFVRKLDPGPLQDTLQNKIICLLYDDLSHPPATYVGNKHAWRTADGSGNNIDIPDMGKAGNPYSRSVQQSHPIPKNQLPDPGLIFDTLLKRKKFVQHPGGLSSLMFAFAALVIHSVFRTSHTDPMINETSSYVDLAPLYGNNPAEQDKVRKRDGRGLLWPDCFCEDRLLLLPPAVCTLLILFNRNHNYIAKKLLEINERGTWVDPDTVSTDDPSAKGHLATQEEEIFQTTRLINCGWFGAVVFSDYFSAILGLVRYGSSWSLVPFGEMRNDNHTLFERGKGNVCSAEFNCLYRWHAATSVEDEKWTQTVFTKIFGDKPVDELTTKDFQIAAHKMLETKQDLKTLSFGGLTRQADHTFKNEDLAEVLQDATSHPAATFGARGTPEVFRLNEIIGIEQSRTWGVCSLNDFRRFLGLKPFASFLEWNRDPEIAEAAEKLYGNIDFLELYAGLQAEEHKPLVEGAGLCPSYTVSRAILSDAIALTRGDRHFTHDFTPYNLTSWGFADCQRDPNAFGFGSTLGRLLLRTLPEHYTENSVYTFFPFMLPDEMKKHLEEMGLADQYDISRPGKQAPIPIVTDHEQITKILSDTNNYATPYQSKALKVGLGKGFYPAEGEKELKSAVFALNASAAVTAKIGTFFFNLTQNLIREQSFTLVDSKTCGINVVRDVTKVVGVYWLADLVGFQLKTKSNPDGDYTPAELFEMLSEIYAYIFLKVEAAHVKVLEGKVKGHVEKLKELISDNIDGTVASRLSILGIFDSLFSKPRKPENHELIQRLYELFHTSDELTNCILAIMVVTSAELSIALSNMVNLYIGSGKDDEIRMLANSSSAHGGLDGYVLEAYRMEPPFRGVYRVAKAQQTISTQSVKANDVVFLDVNTAQTNVFKNPDEINISRSKKDYLSCDGMTKYLGEDLAMKILTSSLSGIFGYATYRRAEGYSGTLQRFPVPTRPELSHGYLNAAQLVTAWPTSLVVKYETK